MNIRLAFRAIQKLEKREHLLKWNRELWERGRITEEEFRRREAAIVEQYRLTPAEAKALEQYLRKTRSKRS